MPVIRHALTGLGLLVMLTGCGTPEEVRSYAKTTDLHIITISDNLQKIAALEDGLVESRRITAIQLNEARRATASNLERSKSLHEEDAVKFMKKVIDDFEKQQKEIEDNLNSRRAFEEKLDGKLKRVAPVVEQQKPALAAASKSAGALAEEMPKKELAEFLFKYAKSAKKAYEDSRKAAEDAAEKEKSAAGTTATSAKQ